MHRKVLFTATFGYQLLSAKNHWSDAVLVMTDYLRVDDSEFETYRDNQN